MYRTNENNIRKALKKITNYRNEILKTFEELEKSENLDKETNLDIKVNELLTKISNEANKAYWGV